MCAMGKHALEHHMTNNGAVTSSHAGLHNTTATNGVPIVKREWVIGAAFLPYGMVLSLVIVGVPFLLSARGADVERIALVSAASLSPLFWTSFFSPVVDAWFSRRTYAAVFLTVSAAAASVALATLSPDELWLPTLMLVLAVAAAVLFLSAVGGWVSEFVDDARRGRVGGWTNAAILAGGLLSNLYTIGLSQYLPLKTLAILFGVQIVVSAAPLSKLPRPHPSTRSISQVIGGVVSTVSRTAGRHDVRLGLAMFLAPAGAGAALNLFSGLGRDFVTSGEQVMLVSGVGSPLASVTGSLVGGRFTQHGDRRRVFLAGGMLAGLGSILMAITPHTPLTFTMGVLWYSAMVGIILAAFTAHSLELVGESHVAAATMISIFLASLNGASAYMTWFDGLGYRWGGVTGLFLIDGTASIVASALLAVVIGRRNAALS